MIEPLHIDRGRHGARGEQRLDLRGEVEDIALPRPMQRTDADAVAREQHDALGEVEQHEGELPLELREQILAVLLVEMHDQLAVAAAAEDMAARLQLGLALRVVEQLAVADHGDGAVLVEDWLLAVTKPDDAEPLLDGADARCEQGAGLVRPAMGERRAHARDLRPIRLPSTLEVDHTCQTAHEPSLDCFAADVKRVQRSDRPSQTCCRGVIRPRKYSDRPVQTAVGGSLMQPLGLFYGYENACIQGISPAYAAISPASVR